MINWVADCRRDLSPLSIYLWLYSPLLGLGRFFSFLLLYTVGRIPWTGDRPVARPLHTHRRIQTQSKCTETAMPWVSFEPTIPAFERAKTVHASDRTATVNGTWAHFYMKMSYELFLWPTSECRHILRIKQCVMSKKVNFYNYICPKKVNLDSQCQI
jgi:hypothetical protein